MALAFHDVYRTEDGVTLVGLTYDQVFELWDVLDLALETVAVQDLSGCPLIESRLDSISQAMDVATLSAQANVAEARAAGRPVHSSIPEDVAFLVPLSYFNAGVYLETLLLLVEDGICDEPPLPEPNIRIVREEPTPEVPVEGEVVNVVRNPEQIAFGSRREAPSSSSKLWIGIGAGVLGAGLLAAALIWRSR